jgi:hypothetical protein
LNNTFKYLLRPCAVPVARERHTDGVAVQVKSFSKRGLAAPGVKSLVDHKPFALSSQLLNFHMSGSVHETSVNVNRVKTEILSMVDEGKIKEVIAENIKRLRGNMTQAELAILAFGYDNTEKGRKAGQSRITTLERGKHMPYIHELYLISRALHVKIDDLIKGAFHK